MTESFGIANNHIQNIWQQQHKHCFGFARILEESTFETEQREHRIDAGMRRCLFGQSLTMVNKIETETETQTQRA